MMRPKGFPHPSGRPLRPHIVKARYAGMSRAIETTIVSVCDDEPTRAIGFIDFKVEDDADID